jgi:hypothetical protein
MVNMWHKQLKESKLGIQFSSAPSNQGRDTALRGHQIYQTVRLAHLITIFTDKGRGYVTQAATKVQMLNFFC